MSIKNRNPFNLKNDPSDPWRGSAGMDSRGHAIFRDNGDLAEAWATRAAVITLAKKVSNHKDTLGKIIAGVDVDGDGIPDGGWAPVNDTIGSIPGNASNEPDKYADFLAERMGITADGVIPMDYRLSRLVTLLQGIIEYENGIGNYPVPIWVILRGIALYLKDKNI